MSRKAFSSIEQLFSKIRDERYVRLALEGDSRAFNNLISLYKTRVNGLGMSFFKNHDDSDDFVQEVFVKVYVNLPNFRFDSSFSTWLTKIAWTTAINAVNRRKEYLPLVNEEYIKDESRSPEEELIRQITRDVIRDEVKNLPENYGACIEMYFFYDLSYDEISKITGFPMNTIKSHIFRAKKILAEKLRSVYEQ